MEEKIVECRLAGKSFWELDQNGIRVVTDQIMLRSCVLYGSVSPMLEEFAALMSQELEIYILQVCPSLTESEIDYALRLGISSYKYRDGEIAEKQEFYNIPFCVMMFATVIEKYLVARNSLDRKIQNFIEDTNELQ